MLESSNTMEYCGSRFQNIHHRIVRVFISPNPVDPSMDIIIQRISYGVIFKEELKLLLAKEYWLHIFHTEIPKRFLIVQGTFCNVQSRVREYILECHINSLNSNTEKMAN